MELPVEEWQACARRRWASLTVSSKEKFCQSADLGESFLASCAHLRTEDETVLHSLRIHYSVEKCPGAAAFYREEGNKRFQRTEYAHAAVLYSKAASHAASGSEDIAVCYANRSAALFHLGHFTVCLVDIERALENGYPEKLKHKALLRKADCFLHLGRCRDALKTLHEVEEKLVPSSTLSSNAHQSLLSNVANLRSRVKECQRNSEPGRVLCVKNYGETLSQGEAAPSEDTLRQGEAAPSKKTLSQGEEVPSEKTLSQGEAAPSGETLSQELQDLGVWDENPLLSKVSAAVIACFRPARGRHLVAARNIDPGETLLKEESFVSVLIPAGILHHGGGSSKPWDTAVTNEDLHCHRCLARVHATVPCQGCSYAKYCSQRCMQQAWGGYHWAECAMGGALLALGVFCHVALRTVLLAGFGEVSRLVKQHHRDSEEETASRKLPDPETPYTCSGNAAASTSSQSSSVQEPKWGQASITGCSDDWQYRSSYQALFSLLTHAENQSPEHRFLCALSTAAICQMLRPADLQSVVLDPRSKLKKELSQEWSPERRILGVAMLRHMLQLQCNALAVTTIQEQQKGCGVSMLESWAQVRLATALFPVASLLNHSCDPNTSVSFRGRSAIVRAAQPIRSGEEVSLCYGPHRSRMAVTQRRRMLSRQYFFKCLCHACLEEQHSEVRSTRDSYCCPDCKAPMQGEDLLSCSSGVCTLSVPRERLLHQQRDLELRVSKAVDLLEADKPDLSVQLLAQCRTRAQGFLCSEHILVAQIEDNLAQTHAARGDWPAAAMHLRRSIRSVELRHGSSSIELGHELFKLAQILFNGRAVTEAMGAIVRAEQVLTVHYGPQHELLQELQQMKACLSELLGVTGCGVTEVVKTCLSKLPVVMGSQKW